MTFGNEFLEDFVHHTLKCCGGVGEAKEHDERFEKTPVGAKHRFSFIALLDADVGVFPPYVKLGEDMRAFELIDELAYEGEGVRVLDHAGVQVPIILDGAQASVFLFDKENGLTIGDFEGWMYPFSKCS
jgi:hypothetical protein